MYVDRKTNISDRIAGVILAVLVIFGAAFLIRRASLNAVQKEAEYAMRDAVRRVAMQCFSVEGFYPSDLDYLSENYGLRINTEKYDVIYEVVSDNLPPNVRVMKKGG